MYIYIDIYTYIHVYIYLYTYGTFLFVSCTETMKGGPAHKYLALPWALALGPCGALPLGPWWGLPYRAKRGMLGAKRRGS